MVTLQTYIPARLLQIVKSFWCLRVSGFTQTPYTENILPDGHHEIIFHLSGDNAKRRNGGADWINEPDSFFAGQTLHSYSLELKNNSLLYGIRFYPHTLNQLFGFPADVITNNMLPLYEIPGTAVLKNCVTEKPEETFKNFETALLRLYTRADLSSSKFQYIHYSIEEILKSNGDIKIDRLTKETGISQRHFDTLFRQSVGINPKSFCNIIQLNHFICYRKDHPHKKLTECCYEAGFFDQSHLVKLFRAVTGQSPKEYFKGVNYISNYFSEL